MTHFLSTKKSEDFIQQGECRKSKDEGGRRKAEVKQKAKYSQNICCLLSFTSAFILPPSSLPFRCVAGDGKLVFNFLQEPGRFSFLFAPLHLEEPPFAI